MRGYFIEDNVQLEHLGLYDIRLSQQNSLQKRKSATPLETQCVADCFGRDEATRTPDPYVPNVVRYQLRYIPMPNECQLQTAILLTQLAFFA